MIRRIFKAGGLYFILVFLAGAILGSIRELWLVPHIGRVPALILEAPFLLAAMIGGAQWSSWRLDIPTTVQARLGVGLVALALLLLTELSAALLYGGMSFEDYLASFRTAFGVISVTLFLVFAAMPVVVSSRRAGSGSRDSPAR